MKKIISALMVAAFIFCVSGCRGTTEEYSVYSYYEGDGTNTVSGNTQVNDGGNISESGTGSSGGGSSSSPLNVDLKGAEISIYSTHSTFSPDSGESKAAAAQASMLKQLQSKINCKITVKNVGDQNLKSFAISSAAAGQALCNIIEVPIYDSGSYITGNLVENLKNVPTLDLSKNYISYGDIINVSTLGSGTYACSSKYNFFGYYLTGVYFNKRILSELGYDENHIYDLEKSGKWTYSEYRKLATAATKDLDGITGMSENDQWGQAVIDVEALASYNVIASYRAETLSKNSSNKLVYNANDSKVLTALNMIYDVFIADGSRFSLSKTDADIINLFASGKALFLYSPLSNVSLFTGMNDDYGFVPTPKADNSSEYASSVNWNASVFMLPDGQSNEELANSGAFLQALCYLEEDVVESSINEYENRYFIDDQSSESVAKVLDTQRVTTAQMFSKIDNALLFATSGLPWDMFNTGNRLTASDIEKNKSAAEAVISDLNAKIK